MIESHDPIAVFDSWLKEALKNKSITEPTAFTLATADEEGRPAARMVLLKKHSDKGFVFYTNLTSKKGGDLKSNPAAAMCFYWGTLGKQVRIEGSVEKISEKEADHYFAQRGRDSQISAWASRQSAVLHSEEYFEERITHIMHDFADVEVPRPPFWSGYIIIPNMIEFWQDGMHRRHKRDVYHKLGNIWQHEMIYP